MNSTVKTGLLPIAFAQLGCKATNHAQKESSQAKKEPLSVVPMIGDGRGIAQISTTFYFGENSPKFQHFNNISFYNFINYSLDGVLNMRKA